MEDSKTRIKVKLIAEAVAREKGSCRVRKYLMVGFVIAFFVFVFCREDPNLICDKETQLTPASSSPSTSRVS